MKTRRGVVLLACLLLAAGLIVRVVVMRPQPAAREARTPEATLTVSNSTGDSTPPLAFSPERAARTKRRLRQHVAEMAPEERARFERSFVEKLEPAVRKWSKIYEGHLPFRLEDVTADTFVECLAPDFPSPSYVFMVNGATLSITVPDGSAGAFVDYMMAPDAKYLFQVGGNPQPPAQPPVAKSEILRLLKADSGSNFPPNEISIRYSASNGGISVDVGKDINATMAPPPKFTMVFGPDGNLVSYGRADDLNVQ